MRQRGIRTNTPPPPTRTIFACRAQNNARQLREKHVYPIFVPRVKTTLANPQDLTAKGRPSVRTPANAEMIVDVIAQSGISLSAAAAYASISAQSARQWADEDQDFSASIARAAAQWQVATIAKIQSGDHKTAAQLTWLMSKHLRGYGDRLEIEHSGEIAQRVINPERLSELQARVGKASAS